MRMVQGLLALPFLTGALSAATVGFQGDFAPANFTLNANGGTGTASTGAAPDAIVLIGSNDGPGGNINTDFSLILPGSATTVISFDWIYNSADSPGFDSGSFLNGAQAVFLSNTEGQSGTVKFLATPGEIFGFRVNTVDDGFGPGVLTITNFSTSDVPALPLGQWVSETYTRANGGQFLTGLVDADDAINNGILVGSGDVDSVNYVNPPSNDGNIGGGTNPFGIAPETDHFTVKSTGFLQITEAGDFQFRNNTDDGSRLRIDLNGNGIFEDDETVILDDVFSSSHNADSAILNLLEGQYMIEHVWFESGGDAQGELSISLDGGAFLLFGNPQGDGFGAFFDYGVYVTAALVIPEPATATLALIAITGLMSRRRRLA